MPIPYSFFLDVDATSGALLLLPTDEKEYLAAVKDALHTEPEAHIEIAASSLENAWRALNPRTWPRKIVGLTSKDESLLKAISSRFSDQSVCSILYHNLHPLESLQLLSKTTSDPQPDTTDIVIARHIMEHARSIETFLAALRQILAAEGLCYVEVPDSSELLYQGDLSQLWEEHSAYFTESTMYEALRHGGFEVLDFIRMESDGELILFAIMKKSNVEICSRESKLNLDSARLFISKLPFQIESMRSRVKKTTMTHTLYIYGANHKASTFLDMLDFPDNSQLTVLDDDKSKFNLTIGLGRFKISSLGHVSLENPTCFIVAVAEGRSPQLYSRLRDMFPSCLGHRVESLAEFTKSIFT
jgi:hypothetical protein